MNDFLPFALPDINEDEIMEVVDSMKSGWLSTGPKTKQFEKDFSNFLGGNIEAVAVNSATAGLHLALEALGVGVGDEIITTVYTFTATAEVIRYMGAHPVFVDINIDTLNIDADKLEQVITDKTKAIIVVHYAGFPCDMDAILNIAKKYNLKIIEDAAHALPTKYKNNLIGTLKSDVTVFSFYATKTITTGEGGMIVTRNKDVAERCKIMRLHGINRDVFERYTSNKPSWFYEVIAPGFKYNMTDIASSIGIHQLRKAYKFHARREYIANIYNDEFKNLPIILPKINLENGTTHSWHLYVIRLTKEIKINRDHFIKFMIENGVGCSVHYVPLHLQPYWREQYKLQENDFPNAMLVYENIISLPIYTKMNNENVGKVINTVKKILK